MVPCFGHPTWRPKYKPPLSSPFLQIGHRDFDVEKRLRRDLKRTHALLADVQLLLETSGAAEPGPSGSQEEWAKLRSQVRRGAPRKGLGGQAVA